MVKKTSKYMFMADLHLSNKLPYSKPTDDQFITDRFAVQLEMLSRIAQLGEENDVSGYIVLGDLFDKSTVDPVTFFQVAKVFKEKFARPVYILPGNHDSVTITGGPYIVDIFELLDMKVITHKTPFSDEFINFWPLEYLSIDASQAPLAELRELCAAKDNDAYNLLLFHNTVVGAKNGYYVSGNGFSPEFLVRGFNYALGGHFHEPHSVSDKVEYCGAPMQLHFGDADKENCVMIGEFANGSATYTRHDLGMPKFYNYKDWDIDFELLSGDYVRLTIESTIPELHAMADKSRKIKKQAMDYGVHFFFQHKTIAQHSLRMDVDRDEMSYGVLIEAYVKSEDVNTDGLKEQILAEYGQRMLKKAQEKNGII